MAIRTQKLIEIVSERVISFLRDEMEIEIEGRQTTRVPGHRLTLRYLTTVITLGGEINMNVIFSYEKRFIDKIFRIYTDELDLDPDERQDYMEETAGHMINIVVGNATADFGGLNKVTLTPPIMITEAKSIAKSKSAEFFATELHSIHGSMNIFCIAPKQSESHHTLSDLNSATSTPSGE